MSHKDIGLHELIKGVRREFQKIMNDPEIKSHPLFMLRELEFEISVLISKAGKIGLKFMLPPIGGGGETNFESEKISKIKIKFEPFKLESDSTSRETIYSLPEK